MGTTGIDNHGVKLPFLAAAWKGKSGARSGLAHDLSPVIDRLRQRWRLRLLLGGLFQTLAIMIALILISAWWLNHWHFTSNAVWFFRFVTILSLICLLLHFCIKPLRRQVSDARVALYLEEHEPSLRSAIVSAVDASQSSAQNTSPQLVTGLVEQALDACARVQFGQAVEQQKLRQAASKLGIVLLVVVGLAAAPPDFLRHGAAALLMPWTNASQYSPYRIELAPGNIEIARAWWRSTDQRQHRRLRRRRRAAVQLR